MNLTFLPSEIVSRLDQTCSMIATDDQVLSQLDRISIHIDDAIKDDMSIMGDPINIPRDMFREFLTTFFTELTLWTISTEGLHTVLKRLARGTLLMDIHISYKLFELLYGDAIASWTSTYLDVYQIYKDLEMLLINIYNIPEYQDALDEAMVHLVSGVKQYPDVDLSHMLGVSLIHRGRVVVFTRGNHAKR